MKADIIYLKEVVMKDGTLKRYELVCDHCAVTGTIVDSWDQTLYENVECQECRAPIKSYNKEKLPSY